MQFKAKISGIAVAGLSASMLISADAFAQHRFSPSSKPGIQLAQGSEVQTVLRTKSEVMREVKKRYDARVLKISLNEQRNIYLSLIHI